MKMKYIHISQATRLVVILFKKQHRHLITDYIIGFYLKVKHATTSHHQVLHLLLLGISALTNLLFIK